MKKLLFLLLLFSQTALGAEPVGQIADLVGGVWVTQEGQSPALAAFKQSIHVGDVIETKKEGAVKILFVDDTLLTIKENSKALITKFLFNSEAKERKAVFDVLFGRVRTVVGRFFGKAQPVEIKTPLAIAGIRGTDVGALVQKKSSVVYCCEGLFDAYNVTIPDKIIQVKEGFFTEVLEGIPPSELLPIPADVLDNKRELFDITVSSKSEAKEEKASGSSSQSASSQITQQTTKAISTETAKTTGTSSTTQTTTTTGTSTSSTSGSSSSSSSSTSSTSSATSSSTTSAPEGTQAGECQSSLLACGGSVGEQESFVTSTTPAASTTTTEILPGAAAEVTNPATITITLPTP